MPNTGLKSQLLVGLMFVLLSPFTVAAPSGAAQSVDSLENLLQQQNTVAAWQLASDLQAEHEGDLRFDYLYALAARAAGQLHQAVFALERAMLAAPAAADLRLLLGVSYFELGNFPAAEREFQALQQAQLPQQEATLVQQYLTRLGQLRDAATGYWQNWLQLSAGSDSNPNSGIDDEFVFVPLLGQVRLFESSLARRSSFQEVQAQLNYVLPQTQHAAFYASAGVLHSNYREDMVYNRSYASLLAGYQSRWRGLQWSTELFYRPIELDGDSYLQYQGMKAALSRSFGESISMGVDLTWADFAYADLPLLDKRQWLLEGWLALRIGQAVHRLLLRSGDEQSEFNRSDFNARDAFGIGYLWKLPIGERWHTGLQLDYSRGDYQAVHPLFAVTRQDSYLRAEVEVSYSISPDWRVLTSLSHLRNNSNLSLYQYRRNRGWVGVRYAF